MITIESDLYVVIREMGGEHSPQPRPLANGFSENVAYRVVGLSTPSETSEAYLILVNDREEIWFISNRHVRMHGVFAGINKMRFPVGASACVQLLRMAHGDFSH